MVEDFMNLIFPRTCINCNSALLRSELYLCTSCRIRIPKLDLYGNEEHIMFNRFKGHLKFTKAFAFMKFHKSGMAQPILHAIKYGNLPELGTLLGQWLGMEMKENNCTDFELILPVPLYPSRRRKRGYNQSDYICQGISNATGITWDPSILGRSINTRTQTKKERSQRWKNMKDAFFVRKSESLESKNVLLVDDVVTTGATMIACGNQILEHRVSGLSFACLALAQ